MELEWMLYPLVIMAGLLAGFVNTLAGNGSAITLPLLVFLGLSPNVANGTNRVGVAIQSIIAYRSFQQRGMVPMQNIWWLILPTLTGAMLGASIAVDLDEDTMNLALGILMIVLLGVVLLNPKKWLAEQVANPEKVKRLSTIVIFFLVGVHGGFIQAGVGILLLAALVLGASYGLNHANGVKLLLVLIFTVPALSLFVYMGQVNWFYGGLLSIGQSVGGWLGAHFATRYKNANLWIRRLLIVVILLGIVKFFKLYEWFVF